MKTKIIAITVLLFCLILISCSPRIKLQGKFVTNDGAAQFLSGKKISLKQKKPAKTISRSTINDFGEFQFKRVNPAKEYFVELDKTSLGFPGGTIYLSNAAGKVIREIHLEPNVFKFGFLSSDINSLAVQKEEDANIMFQKFMHDSTKKEALLTRNIYYAKDAYQLSSRNKKNLSKIIANLKKNKNIKIDISSFTDANGDDAYNLDLSQKRAKELENYFISKGITKDRLVVVGYGETKILNRCANGIKCSDIEHSINRRTEFLFQKPK